LSDLQHDEPTHAGPADPTASEIAAEQAVVDRLYARLDVVRDDAARELDRIRRTPTANTPQSVSERDAFDQLYSQRIDQLRAVEDRLCFGRLDLLGGEMRHVGRIGLSDGEQGQLLVDWRAPAAEPFYQATAADPRGVVRRRHLSTRLREVVGVEDEVLDLDALGAATAVAGEGALLVALNAARTGRMKDIVATIQAEQDRIVRAPLNGVLVVQGGPGTGKTAVALHRAAYLLYTHRERIARSGVLVVGPNRTFMRYIEQVLPSLGETGVVMATPGTLFPGVEATGSESAEAAAFKGSARMVRLLADAVRRRQRVPSQPVPLDVDGVRVLLRPRDVETARERARRTRRPHNEARVTFVREMLRLLSPQLATGQRVELSDHRAELDADLRDADDVRREVGRLWLPYTPQTLLSRLWSQESWLARLGIGAQDRALLLRPVGAPFTPADVPLLDELADLLGADADADRLDAAREAADRRAELAYARDVLDMASSHRDDDQTVAGDVVDAERLVGRWSGGGPMISVSERASGDREWAFGHVVVDEAQELSPMAWRLLMRRCPSRSMTVVGDIAQTGALDGAGSWSEVLEPYVPGRWRAEELTVNYRTPAQVMDVAADVLAVARPGATPPESARVGDWPPVAIRCAAGDLTAVERAVSRELTRFATVVVVAPDELVEPLRTVLSPTADGPVSVLGVTAVKGLEFDAVVLYEPQRILAASRRGASDLYVAMTRPTQRLVVLHSAPLPTVLERLPRGEG
jgi:DNA helicase IV